MGEAFAVGDHVAWNSEAGRVSGRIIRVHTRDVEDKGYVHHASAADPQYEIASDKTDHIALHKGAALTRIDDKGAGEAVPTPPSKRAARPRRGR